MAVKAEIARHHVAVTGADIDLAPRGAIGDHPDLRAVAVLPQGAAALGRRFTQVEHLCAAGIVDIGNLIGGPPAGSRIVADGAACSRKIAGGHKAREPAAGDLIPAVSFEQHGHARARCQGSNALVSRGRTRPHVDLAAVARGDCGRGCALIDKGFMHITGIGAARRRSGDIIPLIGGIQNGDCRAGGHPSDHLIVKRGAAAQVDIAPVGIADNARVACCGKRQIVAGHVAGLSVHGTHRPPSIDGLPLQAHPGSRVVKPQAPACAAGIFTQIKPAAAHHGEIRRQRQHGQQNKQRQQRDQANDVCFHNLHPPLSLCI